MDFTLKDVIYLATIVGAGVSVYVGIVVRLTRLEALVRRVEEIEEAVGELKESDATARAEIASLRTAAALRGRRVNG